MSEPEQSETPRTDAISAMFFSLERLLQAETLARELERENQRLQKDVNDLNNLLRHVGWGQGEIDSSASIVEDMEKLEKENQRLREELSTELRGGGVKE